MTRIIGFAAVLPLGLVALWALQQAAAVLNEMGARLMVLS